MNPKIPEKNPPERPSSIPIFSQYQLRAELEKMVLGDLLGPAGGESEELVERSVRDRYLVGVLAPSRSSVNNAPPPPEEEEEEDIPSIPDELSEGGVDSVDEGATDLNVPVTLARLPSSMGMTFCVEIEAKSIQVTASWGHYKREKREDQISPHSGKTLRVWKRYQQGGIINIALKDGAIKMQAPNAQFPDIYVQGQIRKRNTHYVVTLFLVNAQEEMRPKDEYHIFQPKLIVNDAEERPLFCKRTLLGSKNDIEELLMAMLYRHHVEFAIGHGVNVHATPAEKLRDRAVKVETVIVPCYELPQTTPPHEKDSVRNPAFAKLSGLELDMKLLAEADPKKLFTLLEPLNIAYKEWIDQEEAKLTASEEDFSQFGDTPRVAMTNCRLTLKRIEEGLQLLGKDPQAFEAFQFMNKAMWLQRTHSIFAEKVRRGEEAEFDKDIDKPVNRSWRPFQIAFILLNLPGITKLDHPERGVGHEAIADLLFFPTGGGKTEAYLGLSAYTMALRRLQGDIAGRVGSEGVAVLMRYTLRLLTIQQFQRASALICACESIRRSALEKGDTRWGKTPFRIGLWVGRRTTPNRTEDADEAIKQAKGSEFIAGGSGIGTPYQLTSCPWCGSAIEEGQDLEVSSYPHGSGRTLIYCGNKFGQCLFSKRQADKEGLPVIVVDEEIYRRLPTLLIATVDKFAQMPWKGEVQMLFGQVTEFCERHGFKSPEIEDCSHQKARYGNFPATKLKEHPLLRPPDLIIQDELHLISGPLGTLVGLYETAVDKLCTWEVNGKKVRPKVIASTATIKNAEVQVHSLFLRTVNIFPPPGLDVRDNFFSVQREPTEEEFGRRYLGICAPGRRFKAALIRVYVAYLCSAQFLYERYGKHVDPWMTLVGYFNSKRELGGMRRLVDDEVFSLCRKQDRRGLGKRYFNGEYLAELTSRMRSEEIPKILDRLEAIFDQGLEEQRKEAFKTKDYKNIPKKPLDILLATNMISVGVDVKRLGLMIVAGQPKATAEYIQATSRIGRTFPGLVCTVFNWARPRDLSHYEAFEHYHSTFYKHVEPLSVTPFSAGALQRGLAGLLLSMVRLRGTQFNPNEAASKMTTSDPYVQDAIDIIAKRAVLIDVNGKKTESFCRQDLLSKADFWQREAQNNTGGRTLTYTEPHGAKKGTSIALIQSPGLERWDDFTCLNSLREVEPSVKLIIRDGGLDEFSKGKHLQNQQVEETQNTDQEIVQSSNSNHMKRSEVGDVRPSQILTTFGIGSLMDLPNISALVMGLDDWPITYSNEILEERLLRSAQSILGHQVTRLVTPPKGADLRGAQANWFDESHQIGVPVAPFPRWVVCSKCRLLAPLSSGLFSPKEYPYRPDKACYIHTLCSTNKGKPPRVIPARFIATCAHGHLDDFPWIEFVHQGATDCNGPLSLYEIGASGEALDVEVKCEACKKSNRMGQAFGLYNSKIMPPCRGRRPHLRDFDPQGCDQKHMKPILLGASNLWFPVTISVLSLPQASDELGLLVEENWEVLEKAISIDILKAFRQIGRLKDLSKYEDGQIWEAIQKKIQGTKPEEDPDDLKLPEWKVFSKPADAKESRTFKLKAVESPKEFSNYFEKIVLVEKLREVRALIGFTRLMSPRDFDSPIELPPEKRAKISRKEMTWMPACETKGEGIFFQFSEKKIQEWVTQNRAYNREFEVAHQAWRASKNLDPTGYPGLRYVLLHTFSHALIRQLAIECGYTSASISERIYSRDPSEGDAMAGVLIYTSAPDSEGTLGGLCALGEPDKLNRHIQRALEKMSLCASDPLCSEHIVNGEKLHGASCHVCSFLPETSCERGNKYLDRSVLVSTIERTNLAFFG